MKKFAKTFGIALAGLAVMVVTMNSWAALHSEEVPNELK
jgi:cyclic lactone autoinducer peptide